MISWKVFQTCLWRHIVDLGDTIDYIHLLFDEVYSSLAVVREHSNPCIHDHLSPFDISVDTLDKNLEETSSYEILESLACVLH